MAIIKKKLNTGRHASALKRARQAKKTRVRNRHATSTLKTAVKVVRTEKSAETLAKAIPMIAKTARKGIIPRNRARRLTSRLQKAVNAAAAKA